MLFVKTKEKVCRERAKIDASDKFDDDIKENRGNFSKTRNPKFMQAVLRLSRLKATFEEKAYQHHFDNFVVADDCISDATENKKAHGFKRFDKEALGFKGISEHLKKELENI